jgi:stage V sporulation protein AD
MADMKKRGSQTFYLNSRPNIASTGCAVGPMEADGPIGGYFDEHAKDQYFDEETWEKAESKFILTAYKHMMKKVKLRDEDIDVLIAGDLLNQSISSVFGLRGIERPFVGIYGACSTIAEGMCLGSMMVDGGFTDRVACLASSHFCSAERQFRAPLELGNQRCPSTQWTATAAGCVLLENPVVKDVNEKFSGSFPYVEAVTLGKMVDFGVTDSTNMGATMAPADVKLTPYPIEKMNGGCVKNLT